MLQPLMMNLDYAKGSVAPPIVTGSPVRFFPGAAPRINITQEAGQRTQFTSDSGMRIGFTPDARPVNNPS